VVAFAFECLHNTKQAIPRDHKIVTLFAHIMNSSTKFKICYNLWLVVMDDIYNKHTNTVSSLIAREISLAAGCGLPLEDLAPLKHILLNIERH